MTWLARLSLAQPGDRRCGHGAARGVRCDQYHVTAPGTVALPRCAGGHRGACLPGGVTGGGGTADLGVTGTPSTSTGDFSVATADLRYGSDLTELTSQFQRAVQGLRLPAGASPKVVTGSTDSLPVMLLAVSSNLDRRSGRRRPA